MRELRQIEELSKDNNKLAQANAAMNKRITELGGERVRCLSCAGDGWTVGEGTPEQVPCETCHATGYISETKMQIFKLKDEIGNYKSSISELVEELDVLKMKTLHPEAARCVNKATEEYKALQSRLDSIRDEARAANDMPHFTVEQAFRRRTAMESLCEKLADMGGE